MIKDPIPCIVCSENVTSDTTNYMVALEVPYMNLFMHRDCYKQISDILLEFLVENVQKYVEMTKNRKK